MAETAGWAPGNVLAVYAHPDDPEVSCGGSLAAWAAAGAEVRLVIATRGDKGSADPTVDPAVLSEVRAGEVAEAAAALGMTGHELLGHPDGELGNTPSLLETLVALVRRFRPDTVVCPDPTAVFFGDGYVNHVDHRSIGWATLDAVAPAAASPHYFPAAGPPHQVATVLLTGTLEPDVWIDVETGLEAKIQAMFCHRTQLVHDASSWLADFVRHRAEEEGRRAASGPLHYAEGFRRLRLAPGH